jgi:hypothetical protein
VCECAYFNGESGSMRIWGVVLNTYTHIDAPALVHDDNLVRISHRTEAMGNDKHRAIAAQTVEGIGDLLLSFRLYVYINICAGVGVRMCKK